MDWVALKLGTAIAGARALPPMRGLAQQSAQTSPATVGEIVVTVTRRNESVLKIPYNISAISGADLAKNGTTSLAGLRNAVVGLQAANYGERGSGVNNNFVIHGITINDIDVGQSEFSNLAGPTASNDLDGIPLFVNLKLTGIGRIEAPRGPQGTLFGAASESDTVRGNRPICVRATPLSTFRACPRAAWRLRSRILKSHQQPDRHLMDLPEKQPRADNFSHSMQSPPPMRALVYHGPGNGVLEEHAKPQIMAPTDAIIRVTRTTICGTDLHILKGDLPACTPGRILGHEGVGVVEQIGSGVTAFKPGDRVLISCISACGKCSYCRKSMYSHCETGGWVLGNLIDGTQAEFVRTPHADTSLYPIPDGADEEALVMLSDILPTGFECGVLNGQVAPGGIVAIVGSGPIGLAALLTAQFYSPAQIIMIDLDDKRLEVARRFGATTVINSTDGKAVESVMQITGNRGVDTAIEAVGIPATFEMCGQIIAPGGVIANIGVHGVPVALHLERLWDRNITITTRLVDTISTPMLLDVVAAHKVDPTRLITHRFKFDQIIDAYETFASASETGALKVIIEV